MVVLYDGGGGLQRVYYGTDTRATGLLTGATLAIAIALYCHRAAGTTTLGKRPARLLTSAALLCLAGLLAAMHFASGDSSWLFPWGMLATDLAIATVIACAVLLPRSGTAKLFSNRPLCAIGLVSYGIYLWHFPCFLWLDERVTGLHGAALLVLRAATTLAAPALSYVVVEQPIRGRRVPNRVVRVLVPAAGAGTVAALLAAGAVGAQLPGRAFAPVAHSVAVRYTGTSGPCKVHLGDNGLYRTAPLPLAQTGRYILHWILMHAVEWRGGGFRHSAVLTFIPVRQTAS